MLSGPEPISWEVCREAFEPDGSLRDIYVVKSSPAQWGKLLDRLRATYHPSFSVNGNPQDFPDAVEKLFSLRLEASPIMNFSVGSIDVACHFFTGEQIEFDFFPNQVKSQSDLDELLRFLVFIGDTVNDSVILTPENQELYPIITYAPQTGRFSYDAPRQAR